MNSLTPNMDEARKKRPKIEEAETARMRMVIKTVTALSLAAAYEADIGSSKEDILHGFLDAAASALVTAVMSSAGGDKMYALSLLLAVSQHAAQMVETTKPDNVISLSGGKGPRQ